MEFVQNRFNVDINRVFAGDYLDAKGLYWALNGNIPLLNSVFPIDIEKVKSYLLENFKEEINNVFQSSNLNNNINKKRYVMEESYIVFKNKMVIKLAYNYCDILSNEQDHTFVESLTLKIKKFHRRERKKEFEINLISFDNNTFTLKEIEIKKTRLDLKLYYEDEFLEIDKTIQERLNKKNDKGIVLLHGLPGTGKTTYLRYLIGKVSPEGGKYAQLSIDKAIEDLNQGFIDAIVTAPINKQSMQLAGFKHAGHTGYLKEKAGATDVLMMMVSNKLKDLTLGYQ